MESQPAASRGIFGVLLRTNSIFQARIRQAEYHDLKGRRRSGLLSGFMFVHLKGDLDVDPIDWIGCLEPYDASDESRPASRRGRLTRYGIAKDVQELLSGIRTDLDSFSEAEAYALMTSAYRMTEYQFKYEKCVEGFAEPSENEPWKFLEIEPFMKGAGPGYEYLKKLLRAGSSLALKVWQIDPVLKYGARLLVFLLAASVVYAFYYWHDKPLPEFVTQQTTRLLHRPAQALEQIATALSTLTLAELATNLVYAVFVLLSGYFLLRILTAIVGDVLAEKAIVFVRFKDTLRRIAFATVISTVGFIAAVFHLYIFDKRFLRLSRMAVLKTKTEY
jgi:hypothetical protein